MAIEDTQAVPTFHVLTQQSLALPAKGLASWCPTMDLIAFTMSDNTITLYRMNGQKVWTIPQFHMPADKLHVGEKNNIQVEVLTWRPDGKLLAVGYSNGLARICDVNTGKFVHRVHTDRRKLGRVTTIGWTESSVATRKDSGTTAHADITRSLGLAMQAGDITLPHDLFDFDLTQILPKLSVLPSIPSNMSFSVKSAIDNLINNSKIRATDSMDVLLIGGTRGRIVISIFDSFEIGNMKLSNFVPQLTEKRSKVTHHVSTSSLKSHVLLVKSSDDHTQHKDSRCLIFPVDLLFLSNFGVHLSQVAYTITKVQYCFRYIKETIKSISHEYKTMETLAMDYMRPFDDELQKQDGSRASLELFELLVTGVPSEKLRDWLGDELMERGQRKWDKVYMNGYEVLRRLIHENMLPACERTIVLISLLRGLARWKEKGSSLGLEPTDFTKLLDIVSALLAMSHDFIIKLNHELELFSAFSPWLKIMVEEMDALINPTDNPPVVDESMIDTLRVAEFIGGPLMKSQLSDFFHTNEWIWREGESIFQLFSDQILVKDDAKPRNKRDSDLPSIVIGGSPSISKRRGSTGSNMSVMNGGQDEREPRAPGFHQIWTHLSSVYKAVFDKPAMAMQQQLRVGDGVLLDESQWTHLCMRMNEEKGVSVIYIALSHKRPQIIDTLLEDSEHLILVRIELITNGGLSSFANPSCAKLQLPPTAKMASMEFADEKEIIALLRLTDTSELVSLSYSPSEIAYIPAPEGLSNAFVEDFKQQESLCAFASQLASLELTPKKRKTFEHETFDPGMISVNGNPGRRVGIVTNTAGTSWVCFDLDIEVGDEEEEEEIDEEEQEEENSINAGVEEADDDTEYVGSDEDVMDNED